MSRHLRLLHLAPRLSERGGADWHLVGVIRALAELGIAQHLAIGFDDQSVEVPCRVSRSSGLDARLAAPVDVEPLLDAVQPDLIHVHNVVNPWLLEWAARSGALLTVQDHRFFCPGRGKWTAAGEVCLTPMERGVCAACFEDGAYFAEVLALTQRRLDAMRSMRMVTVLSEYMRGELIAVGVAPERVHAIPPFVHGLPSGPSADHDIQHPCLLFVGRLVEPKGVADAIAAWQQSGVALPLVVAGTGSIRRPLEQAANPGVELLGWVSHDRLAALFRRARALVFPPRWQEPFGIVGLEALSQGVPVAAWQSGGIAEWHPDSGLPAWGDVAGLAEAIRIADGQQATLPRRFGRDGLMTRLLERYRSLAPR